VGSMQPGPFLDDFQIAGGGDGEAKV